MQKKMIALILAVLILLSLVAVPVMAAEEKLVIKLHYHREDGVYDDWCVWFWADGKEGADYFFADENGEKVATYEVTPGDTRIGFIVKLPDWAAKDVNEDQFIDVTEVTSGTVHIYVESGVPGYEKVY